MTSNRISEEVGRACKEVRVIALRLPSDEAERIRMQVGTKFAEGVTNWLWEHLGPGPSTRIESQEERARAAVGLAGTEPLLLFFNADDDAAMFEFSSRLSLFKVLDEVYRFEYYICDRNGSFLVTVNHHDFVSAVGCIKQ